jgi:hypothetical protein
VNARKTKNGSAADLDVALQAKRIGRWLMKWGGILCAGGAVVVALGFAIGKYGSFQFTTWPRMAILAGVAIVLYLGFLPILMGAVLWTTGRIKEKRRSLRINTDRRNLVHLCP